MSSRRSDGRAQFLGTEEIVRRLRAAQPARLGNVVARVGQLALLGGLIVGTTLAATSLRLGAQLRSAMVPAAAAPDPSDKVAKNVSRKDASAVASLMPATCNVRLHALRAPKGTVLLLDGAIVGSGSYWEGKVAQGRHVFAARSHLGEQTRTVQLQSDHQDVTLSLGARRHAGRRHHADSNKGR